MIIPLVSQRLTFRNYAVSEIFCIFAPLVWPCRRHMGSGAVKKLKR